MAQKSIHKKFASSGPGGRTCGCCYPQYGKFRKLAKRSDRKVERRLFTQLLKEELS